MTSYAPDYIKQYQAQNNGAMPPMIPAGAGGLGDLLRPALQSAAPASGNTFSQQQIESILGLGQGQATGGYAQNLIDTDPAAAAKYQAALAGMNRPAPLAPATYQTGAMPVGVEPLHQFERSSLAGLGSYQAPAAFGQAAGGLNTAMNMAQQYAQPLTPEQFNQGLQMYSDPYQQRVTDVALRDIDEQAASLRNRIQNRNAGARSFGSSSQGTQLAQLGGETQQARAQAIAQGGQQAFQGATDFMLANRGQGLQGAQLAGNMASGLGNLGIQQQGADLNRLQAQGKAGGAIRGYNQGLSDIAMQNYGAGQNYGYQNLSNLGGLAQGVGNTQQQWLPQPSAGQQWGAGLAGLGQLMTPAQGSVANQQAYNQGGYAQPYNAGNTYFPNQAGQPLPWSVQ
jgi:hypothetical protein